MPGASSRVRRLEKDALLRAKNCDYTREQSNNYITSLQLNYDDDETERHRRHVATRPIRQIQREVDYPVESLEKITERIQQEIKRKQMSTATTATPFTSSTTDRATRDSGITGKYTSNKPPSNSKLY